MQVRGALVILLSDILELHTPAVLAPKVVLVSSMVLLNILLVGYLLTACFACWQDACVGRKPALQRGLQALALGA